jgi:hypothetical protein
MAMRVPVFVGRQAGKVILTGTLSAHEIITGLISETLAVNPNAQRSLARGAGKETTRELLEDDRAHRTPRMAELVGFYLRVMECVEQGDNRQGFFGAVQFTIPESFTSARLRFVEEDGALPGGWSVVSSALENRRLATLEAEPQLGEALFEIGDGQGRCFGFYSFQRAVADAIRDKKRRARKTEDADPVVDDEIARLEELRERIRKFLSATDLSFVCYASDILPDGRLVGLGVDAEKRLYIEGNALNSQATKEELIKYESFSPVIVALQEDRMDPENVWMDVEYIEEDSKVVGRSSSKLFTLSALSQAYCYAMLGDVDPISNPNAEMFRKVAERIAFARAYWKRISRIFGSLWVPDDPDRPGDFLRGSARLAYLEERRNERNVAFQSVFLLALGRLGFALGESCDFDADSPLLERLSVLEWKSWRAYHGDDADGRDLSAYETRFTSAMMKPRLDRASGEIEGYAFEHAGDKIRATQELLLSMLDIPDTSG